MNNLSESKKSDKVYFSSQSELKMEILRKIRNWFSLRVICLIIGIMDFLDDAFTVFNCIWNPIELERTAGRENFVASFPGVITALLMIYGIKKVI